MKIEQKPQFMAYYATFIEFYGKEIVPERAELAWQLVEPLDRTNEQVELAFKEAMRAHTGEFAPQFTAVIEQLRSQSPLRPERAALTSPKPVRNIEKWIADAKFDEPLTLEQQSILREVLGLPPAKPCEKPSGCNLAATRQFNNHFFCTQHARGLFWIESR